MREGPRELQVSSVSRLVAGERTAVPLYLCRVSAGFPSPASYTPALVPAAKALLERVYKRGFVYHRAGLFLTDIVPDTERQQSLTDGIDGERRLRVMDAVDQINRRHGCRTIRPLGAGIDCGWEMRRGRLSGRYTTRLDEVLKVIAR